MSYADNHAHTAFPGRDKLAEDMGVKPRTVSGYIKELEHFGALLVDRRRNKRTGNFYSNHYLLVFDEPGAEKRTWPSAGKRTPPSAENVTLTKPTILTTPIETISTHSAPFGGGVPVQYLTMGALVFHKVTHSDPRRLRLVMSSHLFESHRFAAIIFCWWGWCAGFASHHVGCGGSWRSHPDKHPR